MQSVPPRAFPADAAAAAAEPPPLRIAETYDLAPLATLRAAEEAAAGQIAALRRWNDARRLPVKDGFARSLPAPRTVELTAELLDRPLSAHAGGMVAQPAFDRLAWGAEVRVEEAYRLRLHLANVHLPHASRLWVYGADGETAGPFGLELRGPAGDLWTPSVAGAAARIEVEVPAAALVPGARFGFRIDEVAEMLPPEKLSTAAASGVLGCDIDAQCIGPDVLPTINQVRHAIGFLRFVDGRDTFLCSGGLLNDTDSRTTIPFLLTANHCISTAAEAASLEAFWDYTTSACNGPQPLFSTFPRSSGSTLLTTGASSDFTLLQLGKVPAGRFLLGWNTSFDATPSGTVLYRISYPEGLPQRFSATTVDLADQTCLGAPRPNFLYSAQDMGGTFGGSSGSPSLLANGQVVGQLFGGCGDSDNCSPQQFTVDGAFAASFPSLRPFLDPLKPCVPGPNTLCLMANRFRVEVAWQNQFDGSTGAGRAIPRTSLSGFFSFGDPSNVELLVKILDFGTVIKLFYGELTDLHFTMTVTDTKTGVIKNYGNTPGDCGAIDQSAFASLPAAPALPKSTLAAAAAGSCRPDAHTLCLLSRRFAVQVDWANPGNGTSGTGGAVALSDITGAMFFTDPSNLELLIKMINFGNRIAVFYGTLSDLEYTIHVTDTATGAIKTYHNPPGNFCGGLDNTAF